MASHQMPTETVAAPEQESEKPTVHRPAGSIMSLSTSEGLRYSDFFTRSEGLHYASLKTCATTFVRLSWHVVSGFRALKPDTR